ncbi:MAG: hypothetical protein KAW12_28905 [Candidatus Aminicenantes bacterium]|nr:hypothetical protein [Candidatus Aminicenantes bacterium]
METVVIDTVVENSLIRVPQKFNNRRVKIVIIDPDEQKKKRKSRPRKLCFKIDESLDDVVPFADIKDSRQFVETLRKKHWQ